MRSLFLSLAICLSISLVGCGARADKALEMAYSVKPSEVVVPDDVPLGEYRRIIRPYKNWTLICDENLKKKQRVCNVSQTIVDEDGVQALSWSLAATAGGTPMMIVRVPEQVGKGQPVHIGFGAGNETIIVKTSDCDHRICIAMLPVNGQVRACIDKGLVAEISYVAPPTVVSMPSLASLASRMHVVTVRAPLDGLAAALAGI